MQKVSENFHGFFNGNADALIASLQAAANRAEAKTNLEMNQYLQREAAATHATESDNSFRI